MKNILKLHTAFLSIFLLFIGNSIFAQGGGPGVPEPFPEEPTVPIDNYLYLLGVVAVVLIIAFRKKIIKQSI